MYRFIKYGEDNTQNFQAPNGAKKMRVDQRHNKEVEALRSAMAAGSGTSSLKDIEVYKANRPEDSYMMTDETGKPAMVNLDKAYAPINSHEYGHAIDFSKPLTKYRNIAPLFINPTLRPVSTLYNEYKANKNSWNAIQKVYADDPELLKNFGELREELLTPAYRTYVNSLVPQVIGGTLGTAASFAVPTRNLGERFIAQYIGGGLGTTGGAIVGASTGFGRRHMEALKELQYKLHNDKQIRRRLNMLNQQIINHARKNNYYVEELSPV